MKFSDPHGKVSEAVFQASRKLKNPGFDKENSHFHNEYVSLAGVRDHVHEALADNGLTLIQSCQPAAGPDAKALAILVCETTLLHQSGEWISAFMTVAPNPPEIRRKFDRDGKLTDETISTAPNAQAWAGASTYARRYGLLSILGIVGDDDDDGNGASGIPPKVWDKRPASTPSSAPATTPAIDEDAERVAEAKRVAEVRARQAAAAKAPAAPAAPASRPAAPKSSKPAAKSAGAF